MESFDENVKSASSKMGFIKYVFNFDEESKGEILNIIQYALLSMVPIIILNKISQQYIPEAIDEKGSIEILAEIVIQILFVFLGLYIINRIVLYVPTYSGVKYPSINVIHIILPILMVTLSLQTKLGEKVAILSDRLIEVWDGTMSNNNNNNNNNNKKNKGKGNVKVSQPISGQNQTQNNMQSQMDAVSQSLYSTPISQLPTMTNEQSSPDYNAMFQNTPTPMPGAATPGVGEGFQGGMNEPMAANAGGGGSFGSVFGGGF